MRPAFASPRQAALFGGAVLASLLLPLIPSSWQPPRRELYSGTGWRFGPFPWIEQQVFVEREPIDILFAGSSHLWCDIDTPAVQSAIARERGRPAVVRTLGWPWSGFDAPYFIVKDLLAHRKVRMLVIYDEHLVGDGVHQAAHRWFRFRDEPGALAGIPFDPATSLYAASVLGMPRNLVSLVRPNGPVDPRPLTPNYWQSFYRAENPGDRLGSLAARIGYDYNPVFVDRVPPRDPGAVAVAYSAATRGQFAFTGADTPPYKRVFLERLALLARDHGTKLVVLDTPEFRERRETVATERLCWPEVLPGDVHLVGIPPATLFAGLSDEAVRDLYYDPGHFNWSGQRFFTPAVIPALNALLDE